MSLIDKISAYANSETIAHRYRDSSLTYRELLEKSDALACSLIEKFENSTAPIVVYGHKEHEMLISFLACVKAGHSYIPIDSSLPAERIRDIIDASEAKLILSACSLEEIFKDTEIWDVSSINENISKNFGKQPAKEYQVKPEDTYYIIYTSGSTGNPKGVQITLSCLESFVNWGLSLSDFNEDGQCVFMNQAPFSFDLSVMDLYLALASGSTLFSIDKQMVINLKSLFEYLKKSNISVWVSTPSFAEMCLADKSFNKELLPNLKLFLFCGETLSNKCAKNLHERFQDSKVINTYGPTEATVAVTSVEICSDICDTQDPLPVGVVKDDCKILILDEQGTHAPEGVKGEIVIAGDSVSIGYYKNQPSTIKAFSKLQLNGKEVRSYRTGDEGYLKDGMLYYAGRIDFQVKLNGFRIELEDIENNLRKINFIDNAVVVPVVKKTKIEYLTAFVTMNKVIEEKDFKIALIIKNELKKFLPEYMIPRKIVIKESLPMTSNGKINRKSLMEDI
jgi:D-alanine--poly(phosphoribitol) ligase subunit 1